MVADFSATAAILPGEMDLGEAITTAIQQAIHSGSLGSLPISGVEASAPSGLSFSIMLILRQYRSTTDLAEIYMDLLVKISKDMRSSNHKNRIMKASRC